MYLSIKCGINSIDLDARKFLKIFKFSVTRNVSELLMP